MAQVFTDAQINEILNIFRQNMGHRQYIGARYVPIFGRKGEESILWDNSAPYEPLTIVLYQGNSYTSRQYVPAGIAITNNVFWAETGNYNAQIEQYRQEVLGFDERITQLESTVFDTVADMLETEKTEGIAKTLGYYDKNGSGGAYYEISDAPGEVYVQLNNGKYANLIYDVNHLYVSQFGVKGDASVDDSTTMQKILDLVANNGIINVDVKKVRIDNPIMLEKSYVTIKGNNTIAYNSEFSIADGLEYGIQVANSGSKFEDIYFTMNGNIDDTGVNPPRNIAIRYFIPSEGAVNDDIDALVRNCGFRGFETCCEMFGKNLRVLGCLFTWCKRAIFVKALNGQDPVRGIILKNSAFHTCKERLVTAVTNETAKCWCVEVEQNVPLIELLIDSNDFTGGCFMGFYKGPNSVVITNNISDELAGNAVGAVLLFQNILSNQNPNPLIHGLVYKNNVIMWAATQTASIDHAYYIQSLIRGYGWRIFFENNTCYLQACEHVFDCISSFAYSTMNGNTIAAFGNNDTASSLIKNTGGGNISVIGNYLRTVSTNEPHFNDPASPGIIFKPSDLTVRNIIDRFSDIS